MGMSFLWESHGNRPMEWDGTGINCYGMGMGQTNMSYGQPCILQRGPTTFGPFYKRVTTRGPLPIKLCVKQQRSIRGR